MIGDLFDSPWKILILAAVILVMFGSKKLPDAARSLGKSMRILKTEIHELHEDEPAPTASTVPPAPAQITQQQQVDLLQQQLDELRRQQAPAEVQPAHQVS
ncbi:MAG TPA: Sec-independent protein translocase subunit TatA [Streptosporangiaceae bacterium]|jgi:sec-independent protein translocase protein TatA